MRKDYLLQRSLLLGRYRTVQYGTPRNAALRGGGLVFLDRYSRRDQFQDNQDAAQAYLELERLRFCRLCSCWAAVSELKGTGFKTPWSFATRSSLASRPLGTSALLGRQAAPRT